VRSDCLKKGAASSGTALSSPPEPENSGPTRARGGFKRKEQESTLCPTGGKRHVLTSPGRGREDRLANQYVAEAEKGGVEDFSKGVFVILQESGKGAHTFKTEEIREKDLLPYLQKGRET